MDSTTMSLFSKVMKGAGAPKANGRKKGGVKAHVLIKAKNDVPEYIYITNSARNDRILMPKIQLPAGSILVFDRAYHHFSRWQQWTRQKISWVTHIIKTEVYEIIKDMPIDQLQQQQGICADQLILLGGKTNATTEQITVRLVTYKDPMTQKELQFLTNNRNSFD